MIKIREKCIICNGKLVDKFNTSMPVFMGVNLNNTDEYISEYIVSECQNCGEILVKQEVDLEQVYLNNHNIQIVGEIWENHYEEFSEFIKLDVQDKVVLEISDPSAKIAKKLKNFKRWSIVEPNPHEEVYNIENVFVIKKFFDTKFDDVNNIDLIVHSHLFEHMYDPNSFLQKCNELLSADGIIAMSIPDMEFYLESKYSPFNILHFEHTYFINKLVLEHLANKNGFVIVDEKKYKNHSVFYKLKKEKNIIPKNIKLDIGSKFNSIWKNSISNIREINSKIKNLSSNNVYLFGAHVTSQFYLYNGLDKSKIIGILDNSKSKQGYKLYGTEYIVSNPSEIKNKEEVVIICSHTGIYENEIKKSLLMINDNIKFI